MSDSLSQTGVNPQLSLISQRYSVEPIGKLKQHPKNANQGDVGSVYESIDKNGFYGAIYCQESSGYILAGHTRYYAAKHHGAKSLPVIWLDVEDGLALRILAVDNRARDLALYDTSGLVALLGDIAGEFGSLEGSGFDGEAFEDLKAQLNSPGLFAPPPTPRLPEQAAGPPIEGDEEDGAGDEEREATYEGFKRLGLNLLHPDDHETAVKALSLCGGAKGEKLTRKASGDELRGYNALTVAFLALCVEYLEKEGA